MQLKWIDIESDSDGRRTETGTQYAKIRGGWLVRTYSQKGIYSGGVGWGGLTFIPDPGHENPPEPVE